MTKFGFLIFLIISILPIVSFANECSGNKINFDTCEYAKEYANKFSKSLPMDLNKSMSIESVAAIDNMILMIVQMRYDRAHIEKLYDSRGLNFSDYKESLSKSLDSMCLEEDPVGAFIRLGGAIRYIYRFSDGERFATVTKTDCEISENKNSSLEFKEYQNNRFGFKVKYPQSLFKAMGESDNEDGQVFVSRRDDAQITSYGTSTISSCDIEKIEGNGFDVNYLRKIENTVIFSGTKDGIVIYKKMVKAKGECLILDIRYPILKKETYDDIVTKVSKSFGPSQPDTPRGIQQAENFLSAVKDRNFEHVYSRLVSTDGRIADIKVGQVSFDTFEEFKAVYDDLFTESFIELIDSGLKPKCCVGGANFLWENRVYWGNKNLNVVFVFGKDGYSNDDQHQVYRLTNNLVPNPSFSCKKAQSMDEEAICDDVKLSELDQKIATIYGKAKQFLNRASYENLVPGQRYFIKTRESCGSDRQCLAKKMQARVDDLNRLIKNEIRDLQKNEVSIDSISAFLNGPWETDEVIDTHGVGSVSEENRRDNTQFTVIIDWPNALFEYRAGKPDQTEVSITQSCSVKNVSSETLYQVHEDSYPSWGSAGGSFDRLGMEGYYFVLEFQDDLLNNCGYLAVSGRPSTGFKLFLVKPDIKNINIVKPKIRENSSGGDVLVSMYGVGSFAERGQGEKSVGLPTVAVKMKRTQ